MLDFTHVALFLPLEKVYEAGLHIIPDAVGYTIMTEALSPEVRATSSSIYKVTRMHVIIPVENNTGLGHYTPLTETGNIEMTLLPIKVRNGQAPRELEVSIPTILSKGMSELYSVLLDFQDQRLAPRKITRS